jgi:uncharacterized alkaline shock family protein YloU
MTEGQASISTDILARYAADAAREVDGVRGLTRRRGVRIEQNGALRVELHLVGEWGASLPEVGASVQERVREYLARMADLDPESVDVVFDELA